MGTLTSCSFSTLNFRFRLYPKGGAFREGIQVLERKNSKNICLLCKERSKGKISVRNLPGFTCFSTNGDNGEEELSKGSNLTTASSEEVEERNSDEFKSEQTPASISSRPPTISPTGPAFNNFQIDSFKLMELLGPEKVDPSDIKLIKDKLFGYSTFWVTREEPFGDLGEGILFLGNLRGKREEVFAKLQRQLAEVTGDKYNLFMLEEPNSEGPDPRGGPRVSFGLLRKEVSEPGQTTLWQYVIALLLFILTSGSCVELGIASQINRLPPEVMKYFTDPNAIEPPDMQLLTPFVEAALPLAYGVLGVQLFHEVGHFLAAFPKKVKLSIPYFIPNITLGSFGAITQFKSILPDRRTKVDISLAGPFAGAALSFSMFCVGLLLSSNPDAAGDLVQVPSMLFQGSLLLGLISRATLGYVSMHAATVSIHPLVIAGWCGLTTSAFNMLPVGCLDGGRAVQSMAHAYTRRVVEHRAKQRLEQGVVSAVRQKPYAGAAVLQGERGVKDWRVKEVSVPAGQRSARHSLRFHRGRSNRVVEKVASGLSIGVDQYPCQKALGCRSVEEEGGELEVGGFRSLPFITGAGDLLQGRSAAGVSLDGPDRWGLFSCSGQEAGPSHKQVGSTSGPLRLKALEAIVGGPKEDPFLLDLVFERLGLYSSARTRRRKMDVEVESAGLGCAKTPRADSPVVPLLDLGGGGVTFTVSVSSPGSSSSLQPVESFHQEVHGQCGVATLLELQPYCLQLLGSYVEGQVEGQGISAFSQGSSTRERWSVASTSAAEVDSGEEISVKVGLVASEDGSQPIASTGADFLDSSGVIQAAELASSVGLTPAAKGVRVSFSSGDVESDGVVRDGAGLSGSYPHPGMSLALASSAPLFASFEGSEEGGLRGNQISDSLAVSSAGHPGVEDDCLSRGPSERGSQGIRVDSVVVEGGVGSAIPGAFGKNALIGFGLTTYTLLGLGVLGGPLSLPWGLYVLICQRTPEKPCLNDVSEVGTWRRTALTVAIFLVVLTLLPLWDELAEELGIVIHAAVLEKKNVMGKSCIQVVVNERPGKMKILQRQ
ncbi:hypothetical protein HHK36_016983 [Tetracentron sinense]|uniref:Peptidase M50 domain-containing protein n=1 Tax=Tetracentron sinense TaxID=13715 RepID=A0A835DER7_TETSI|nr:hypothetical protein HHK36_016983 [Tetracentron sinense]